METRDSTACPACAAEALETSLVEWKPDFRQLGGPFGYSLGNFLSGMETVRRVCGRPAEVHLGNFLSGMETTNGAPKRPAISVPWKLP